ncbi:MAG TPA: hypothetical protein VE891_08015 [Allosphingosinicella sp.]|nr:hypothetical protein [Allosphingosinicella sp.]
MRNAGKRLFGIFASSGLLAVSAMVATPAPAQTGGGGYSYHCYDPSTGGYGEWGYGCCEYDVYSGGWYRMYATHWEPCTPPSYSPESADPASRVSVEPAGQ